MIAAPPRKVLARLVNSLSVLNRVPQGSPQIDSQVYPDDCDPTHPFHFNFFLSTNIVIVNRVLLSFFLQAFRSDLTFSSSVSGAGSLHNHLSAAHTHSIHIVNAGPINPLKASGFAGSDIADTAAAGAYDTGQIVNSTTPGAVSFESLHTHPLSISSILGIFESTVATGVTVKVNGTDRTSALGGGTGFTTNQTELALDLAWLTPGAWNTIDLTPAGLGRITGHLTVVSYIQSV